MLAPRHARFIGSRLDFEANTSSCRLALHGCLAAEVDARDPAALRRLKVAKLKRREGTVERWADAHTAIGRGMFKKESDIGLFANMRVRTAAGDEGVLQGAFGKSGKYKVHFARGVAEEARADAASAAHKLVLEFKRFVFDKATVRSQ